MHPEPKALFKEAIRDCLPVLESLVGNCSAPHRVWKKTGEGQWHGETVQQPDMLSVFIGADEEITAASKRFAESFRLRHPQYDGMVGFAGWGSFNLGHDRINILRTALRHLWDRYATFDLDEAAVNGLIDEFETFVDQPSVRFLFRAMLLNFSTPADSIELPDGLRIRRLTEKEVSALYGGPVQFLGMFPNRGFAVHEFCVEGETEVPKILGDSADQGQPTTDQAKASLDKAILSLRTFKKGRVGYDFVSFHPLTFCPVPVASRGFGDLYVPIGTYTLGAEEIEALVSHAKLVFGVTEKAMMLACSRLADAEIRLRPQDRIVDAVIGMEALLLAGIDDRRTEMGFRFALNHAMLVAPDQRVSAFKVARDLYRLRSAIVHGSNIDETKLHQAAETATEALRAIITRFLQAGDQSYRSSDYWQHAYFGLPAPDFPPRPAPA